MLAYVSIEGRYDLGNTFPRAAMSGGRIGALEIHVLDQPDVEKYVTQPRLVAELTICVSRLSKHG